MCIGMGEYIVKKMEEIAKIRSEKFNETKEESDKWFSEVCNKLSEYNDKAGYIIPLTLEQTINLISIKLECEIKNIDFDYKNEIMAERFLYPHIRRLSNMYMEKKGESKDIATKYVAKMMLQEFDKYQSNPDDLVGLDGKTFINNIFNSIELTI